MDQQAETPRRVGGNKRKDVGTRPTCPDHPDRRVWVAGRRRRWSAFHEVETFFCVDRNDKKIKHRIGTEVIGRHPAEHNPDGAEVCPHCEHRLAPVEGPRVGRDYLFAFREQAALLIRVGQGTSFRKASRAIRKRARRYKRPSTMKVAKGGLRNYTARKEPWITRNSKQPALAMAYIDAYAPMGGQISAVDF
jgi:hypothetical protein